jgi:hypothetical protein
MATPSARFGGLRQVLRYVGRYTYRAARASPLRPDWSSEPYSYSRAKEGVASTQRPN